MSATEKRWFSWTQPCCLNCFQDAYPDRQPARLIAPERETCVHCGQSTVAGIYVRIDPATAKHPTLRK